MAPDEILRRWHRQQHPPITQRVSRWLRWRIDRYHAKWFKKQVPREVALFWGHPMTVVHPEHVSKRIARTGYFESELTLALIDKLRPGMVFYDIGAHYGYFSLLGAALVGSEGQVFSFEPTDTTHARLRKNIDPLNNVTPVKKAVYRETTELVFCDMGSRDSSLNHVQVPGQGEESAGQIRVPAVSLDDFVKDHPVPDFVKIDAEGAEHAILEGMAGLIQVRHPMITLEVGDYINEKTGNPSSRENVDLLLACGYSVFEHRDGALQPHTPLETYDYDNLLFCHPDGPSEATTLTT